MSKSLAFIVAVLATFRLTQLIVEDDGPYLWFDRFRVWTGQNAMNSKHHETLADAVRCKYCMGIYSAMLIAVLSKYKWTRWIVAVLGIAGGQSLIETVLDKIE